MQAGDLGLSSLASTTLQGICPKWSRRRKLIDNSRSEHRLDYPEGAPVTAIAIGGNTLTRGLTLEGLVVRFFVRSANAYDTLLQMGRWFGFRGGYADLPRVWMTREHREWFRHLATVEYELRLDIDRYEQQALTPTDIGVRIRTHPSLLVTQKLVGRPARLGIVRRTASSNSILPRDKPGVVDENLHAADAASSLVAVASPEDLEGGTQLWRDVEVRHITDFLAVYRAHPDSPDLDAELLAKYIANEVAFGYLERWSVVVRDGRWG